MKKRETHYVIVLWLFIIFLLAWYIFIPMYYLGWRGYVYQQASGNSIVWRCAKAYMNKRAVSISKEWYDRTEKLSFTKADSVMKSIKVNLCDSNVLSKLYILDQSAKDVGLLSSDLGFPLNYNSHDLFISRMGSQDCFKFNPSSELKASFDYSLKDSILTVHTDNACNTWAYLVSDKRYPTTYILDFDYKPNEKMKETLQIVFCMSSLIDRFRFNLENNEMLVFNMWKDGYSLRGYLPKSWNSLGEKLSLPVGSYSHIRCIVYNNNYFLLVNDNLIMGVKVRNYNAVESHFALIFWNGFSGGGYVDFEIKNMVISY